MIETVLCLPNLPFQSPGIRQTGTKTPHTGIAFRLKGCLAYTESSPGSQNKFKEIIFVNRFFMLNHKF